MALFCVLFIFLFGLSEQEERRKMGIRARTRNEKYNLFVQTMREIQDDDDEPLSPISAPSPIIVFEPDSPRNDQDYVLLTVDDFEN